MKFRHILFPVDFSVHSRRLTQQVEFLARTFGSKVTLLHIFEVPATWYGGLDGVFVGLEPFAAVRAEALAQLQDFPIALPPGSLDRVLTTGDAGGEIANYANSNDVDLIVMGTHGCGRMRGLLLGSVAAKVMHDAFCPVWTESFSEALVNELAPSAYAIPSIVCALELAPEAEQLLRFAAALGQVLHVPVSLIHCLPTGHAWPGRYRIGKLREYLVDSARDEVASVQHRAGTSFPVILGEKGIARSVAECVSNAGAGLVVIGRGKAQEAFGRLRTHGFEILREAPCPVLSYPLSERVRLTRPAALAVAAKAFPVPG